MSLERFGNNPSTTLNGAIDDSQTSIIVNAITKFPTSGDFRIIVDSEIMVVTALGGTGNKTWTVTRGAESTSAVAHLDTADVYHIVTAAALENLRSDQEILQGTLAGRPAAGAEGRLYFPSPADAPNTPGFFRDNGSSWDSYGSLVPAVNVPSLASFSWLNQGSATAVENVGIRLTAPASGSDSFRILYKVYGGSAPKTLVGCFSAGARLSNYATSFIGVRDSSTGRFTILGPLHNSSSRVEVVNYTTVNTYNGTPYGGDWIPGRPWWFSIYDDAINLYFSIGYDGVTWAEVYRVARTSFLTGGPDQFMFGSNSSNNSPVWMQLWYWVIS